MSVRYRDLGTSWYKREDFHSVHPTLPKQMRYQTALHAVCQGYSILSLILSTKSLPQYFPPLPRRKPLFLGQIRDMPRTRFRVCGCPLKVEATTNRMSESAGGHEYSDLELIGLSSQKVRGLA